MHTNSLSGVARQANTCIIYNFATAQSCVLPMTRLSSHFTHPFKRFLCSFFMSFLPLIIKSYLRKSRNDKKTFSLCVSRTLSGEFWRKCVPRCINALPNKDNVSLLLGHNQNKRMEPEGTLTTRRQYAPRLCLSTDELTTLYIACSTIGWDRLPGLLVHNEDKSMHQTYRRLPW